MDAELSEVVDGEEYLKCKLCDSWVWVAHSGNTWRKSMELLKRTINSS